MPFSQRSSADGFANPLTRKLSSFNPLDDEDRRALDDFARNSTRRAAGDDLIADGDRPEQVFLLLKGWAFRYKVLPDGARQIMAYLIPGDLCDPRIFILDRMDHAIGLLSDALVAAVPKETVIEVTKSRPAIARAFWWSMLVDEAVLRHWLVNLGRRNAYSRIAHLFCEMWERMHQVGLTSGGTLEMPVTQEQLGDTMGLTSVHTNRVIQRMRGEGLIEMRGKRLTILNMDAMRRAAEFDPSYLHLRPRP